MLSIEQVSLSIKEQKILEQISFSLSSGSIVALVGHNGAGKSTLMKAIIGMTDIEEGRIVLDGVEQSENFLQFKSSISYIPEEAFLLSELTVEQHFQLYIESYQLEVSTAKQQVKEYIDRFEIKDKLDQYPESLSKGMRQKVQIICALLPQVKLLLVDEPFVGLDVHATEYLITELKQKAKAGTLVLLTTHQLDRLQGFADRYVMLQHGKVIDSGEMNDFSSLKRRFDQT
ncbi:ABC transporter ATP-binding protein [Amphibacillus sp. Q70]|uniref:ABC transporter ATP-binding protein n=1 Tax=Amphibacillus sp. Q70 TaxID=3453416 RepID=UPI003F8452E2